MKAKLISEQVVIDAKILSHVQSKGEELPTGTELEQILKECFYSATRGRNSVHIEMKPLEIVEKLKGLGFQVEVYNGIADEKGYEPWMEVIW